ncbi:M56 family metallopeptidase [Henriciella sp.]|uniref:M56 family metallopeptidase n=1 Tax=Henriciella sp. TaxID=1968823 RepID=UPI00262E471A|nr:M56 family metallopeptidase [Henriciella sp.]
MFNDMSPVLTNGLQTSLAVTVLIGLVLLVRKPFARSFGAKAAYALWLVPLARLLMPPLPANLSLFATFAPAQQAEPTPPVVFEPMVRAAEQGARAAPPPPAAIPAMEFTPAEPAGPGLIEAMSAHLPAMILPVWITGAVLMLGLAWYRQSIFHRLIADDSAPASEAVASAANEIAGELGVKRTFDVRTSLLNGSPLITGVFRPVILLPEWFEADYSPREQRDALTHELMHLKRGDLFALQAAQLMLALQWFNPLAYLGIRAFRIDQEAACDADVLRAGTSSAFSYGRTLVKAARLAGPADSAFSSANLTLAHPIKERLILMQNATPTFRRRLLGTTLALTLGSAAVFTTASCAASATPMDQAPSGLAGGSEDKDAKSESRVYRFSSSSESENRHFVLLSDPFEDLQPRLDKLHEMDFSDIQEEMSVLAIELSDLSQLKERSFKDFETLGELRELKGLAELGDLKLDFDLDFEGMDIQTIETDDGIRIVIPNQEILLSGDMDQLDVQIEKIASNAEAHARIAEAVAEASSERAERIAIVIEERMEEKAAALEARAEAMGARIEAAFEGGLEEDLENAGELVETLAERCEDHDEDQTAPVILSERGEDGETYHALCVNGPAGRLEDADVRQFVSNHAALSDAEKARFETREQIEFEYTSDHD